MATALDIITRAMRSIGVLATGEVANDDMANDALTSLNDVLASLGNESLTVYADTVDALTLTGAASYTYGPSGNINTVRPVSIDSAYYRSTDGTDYPVSLVTAGEWDAIGTKTTASDIPSYVYVNMTYPTATVYVWPVSSSGTLYFRVKKAITAFATLNTSVSLPPGYDRMLRYALAVELMPEYGVQNPQVIQMYIDSKADLKRTNTRPPVVRVSLPFGNGKYSSRIESDGL